MVHSAIKAYHDNQHKPIPMVTAEQAAVDMKHREEIGVVCGAVVANGMAFKEPLGLKSLVVHTAVGAVIGVGAVLGFRAMDYILGRKPRLPSGVVLSVPGEENACHCPKKDWAEQVAAAPAPCDKAR